MLPSQNQSTVDHRKPPVTLMAGNPRATVLAKLQVSSTRRDSSRWVRSFSQSYRPVSAESSRQARAKTHRSRTFFTVMRRPRNSSARVSR